MLAPIDLKRVYRVMRDHSPLLEPRAKQPGDPREHEGRVVVTISNTPLVLGRFRVRRVDGAKLSVAFSLDCCNSEATGRVASPRGYNAMTSET